MIPFSTKTGFNPRTHEECDRWKKYRDRHNRVSIHALTRSATGDTKKKLIECIVSIHALTRSATTNNSWYSSVSLVSIHALTRSATTNRPDIIQIDGVSIHALTRSATAITSPILIVGNVSIHALTRSATNTHELVGQHLKFQSTHSRGVRLWFSILRLHMISGFQSTHSRGVRHQIGKSAYSWYQVSIHALTRSATNVAC